ncbi:MAG: hypothetical protein V1744_03480 [Candidatus Altiarchaeota archaeon]
MVLEFSGGEKAIYECRVQLDPTAIKLSETRLYVTQTRLVFDLDEPLSVELSEIIELSLERFYGEHFIHIRYKDISGVNTLNFVCSGLWGLISNISETIFVYKMIGRLRKGMHPRDIRFLISSSTVELYTPWILLALMIMAPAMGVSLPINCWARLALGVSLTLSFAVFSFTDVYKLLLGNFRWFISSVVLLAIFVSLIVIWNNCSTKEVEYPAVVVSKYISEDRLNSQNIWHCLKVKSNIKVDDLCVARADWINLNVKDRIAVYYLEGPLWSTIVPYTYDDRNQAYVIKHRTV